MATIPETIEEGEGLGKAKIPLRAIMIVIAVVVCA